MDTNEKNISPRSLQFVLRNSILDEQYENSGVRKSPFVGLYHMLIVFQLIYLISLFIVLLYSLLFSIAQIYAWESFGGCRINNLRSFKVYASFLCVCSSFNISFFVFLFS